MQVMWFVIVYCKWCYLIVCLKVRYSVMWYDMLYCMVYCLVLWHSLFVVWCRSMLFWWCIVWCGFSRCCVVLCYLVVYSTVCCIICGGGLGVLLHRAVQCSVLIIVWCSMLFWTIVWYSVLWYVYYDVMWYFLVLYEVFSAVRSGVTCHEV